MYEPATLLAAPSNGQFISNGPRISVTCVAYGSPIPFIEWTQNGVAIEEDGSTNIYRQGSFVDEDGDILAVSTLELCDAVFMRGADVTTCTTRNGIQLGSDVGRVQSSSFVIDPRSELVFLAYKKIIVLMLI